MPGCLGRPTRQPELHATATHWAPGSASRGLAAVPRWGLARGMAAVPRWGLAAVRLAAVACSGAAPLCSAVPHWGGQPCSWELRCHHLCSWELRCRHLCSWKLRCRHLGGGGVCNSEAGGGGGALPLTVWPGGCQVGCWMAVWARAMTLTSPAPVLRPPPVLHMCYDPHLYCTLYLCYDPHLSCTCATTPTCIAHVL